ncbi:hypothetical protein ACJO2E_00725 [Marinobacter sp. M1N3S26]|uniref:hypothetical protein n=1 Tax=unclassified Marinobacter TaxID=83889 RepID=UPI00387B5929
MKRRETLVGRILLLVISMAFVSACQASGPKQAGSGGQSDFISEALVDAVEQTHFSAVVRHVSAERRAPGASDSGPVFLHRVEVREVFRGPEVESLTYALYAEPGESSASSSGWVIITLCRGSDEGYEWPGTGAIFPATEELVEIARKAARNAGPDQQAFNQCDW